MGRLRVMRGGKIEIERRKCQGEFPQVVSRAFWPLPAAARALAGRGERPGRGAGASQGAGEFNRFGTCGEDATSGRTMIYEGPLPLPTNNKRQMFDFLY